MKISVTRCDSNVRTACCLNRGCCHTPKVKFQLLSLPVDILLAIFKRLGVSDLAVLRLVNKELRDFIDNKKPLWKSVSLPGLWPASGQTITTALKSVSDMGNIEALIKLGIAHVYNRGIATNLNAAQFFVQAESLSPHGVPFTWLILRPPWVANNKCAKAGVFDELRDLCLTGEVAHKSIFYCIGKILSLQEDANMQELAMTWFYRAAQCGSHQAVYKLWTNSYPQASRASLDPAAKLQMIRELRECASMGNLDAQLELCHEYAKGNFGGLNREAATGTFRKIVENAIPTQVHNIFQFQVDITPNMRYILVDWLVEVAVMKDFSSELLHIAVNCVDRYLKCTRIKKKVLQLLGISCMLIASRYEEGRDIITIREAAWLTDDTYKYEDVVRMLGEVMACIRGEIRVTTILDFVQLFYNLAPVAGQPVKHLANYLADLSILHVEFGRFSQATVAGSCLFLANLILSTGFSWPCHMASFTGLQVEDLLECTILIYHKCLCEESLTDHRDQKLNAVKERYSQSKFAEVGKIEIPSVEAICSSICLYTDVRTLRRAVCAVFDPQTVSKIYIGETCLLDLSLCSIAESGYEGDGEDEGDSWEEEVPSDEELRDPDEVAVCKRPRMDSLCEPDYISERGSSTPSLPLGNLEQFWKPVIQGIGGPTEQFEEKMEVDFYENDCEMVDSKASSSSKTMDFMATVLRVEPGPSTNSANRQPLQELQNKGTLNLRLKSRQSSPWEQVKSTSRATRASLGGDSQENSSSQSHS